MEVEGERWMVTYFLLSNCLRIKCRYMWVWRERGDRKRERVRVCVCVFD